MSSGRDSRRRALAGVLALVMAVQGVAGTALGAGVGAMRQAERVPARAELFAAWDGTGTPGYGGSKLRRVAETEAMRRTVTKHLPALLSADADEGREMALFFEKAMKLMRYGWEYPGAVYMVSGAGGMGGPGMAAFIDAGAEVERVQREMERELAGLDVNSDDVVMSRMGGLLVITPQGMPVPMPVAEVAGSLGADARFIEATGKLGARSRENAAVVYVDLARLGAGLAGEPVFGASGAAGAKWIGLSGWFDDKGEWRSELRLAVPEAERRGVVGALLGRRAEGEALLGRVPADAVYVSEFRLDLKAVVEAGIEAAAVVEPGIRERMPQVWAIGSAATGVRLKEDFVEALGAEWVMYEPADAPAQLVAVHRARNPVAARRSLELMSRAMQRLLLMQARSSPDMPRLAVTETPVEGAPKGHPPVVSLRLRPAPATTRPGASEREQFGAMALERYGITFGLSLEGGLVVVGTDEKSVVAAVKGAPAASIVTSEPRRARLAQLGAPPDAITSFVDLPRAAAAAKSDMGSMLGALQAALPDMDIAAIKRDAYGAVEAELGTAAEAWWVDADGLVMRSVTPFPGAELYATYGGTTTAVVGGVPLGLSVMLPSLARARETANRVKSASNLRQIGQGLFLYANDHGGKFPDDLGALYLGVEAAFAPEVFLSPRTGGTVPADVAGAGRQEIATWVSGNSDYVYLGKGLTTSASPERAIAHERLDVGLEDGVNVLFADGRVEFVTMAGLEQVLKAGR